MISEQANEQTNKVEVSKACMHACMHGTLHDVCLQCVSHMSQAFVGAPSLWLQRPENDQQPITQNILLIIAAVAINMANKHGRNSILRHVSTTPLRQQHHYNNNDNSDNNNNNNNSSSGSSSSNSSNDYLKAPVYGG